MLKISQINLLMTIILDGKKLAKKILEECRKKTEKMTKKPGLAVIFVGKNPASQIYVRNKKIACQEAGIDFFERTFDENISQEKLITEIEKLNCDHKISGFIVQLPLPKHIFVPKIIRAINPKKDVDGFHAYNLGKMFLSPDFEDLPPATPAGIIEILNHYKIEISGKNAVVVGHSNIVGKPISTMLLNRGATVVTCHKLTKNLTSFTKLADILVVAVGKINLITAEMVKKGVVVIDVGMNRDKNGKICGDVDFEKISELSSAITPVPGGVGPMTVASLIKNTIRASEKKSK